MLARLPEGQRTTAKSLSSPSLGCSKGGKKGKGQVLEPGPCGLQLLYRSTSTAASASGHGICTLLLCGVTQGLEVEREGMLYQKHQGQNQQRSVPGESMDG